MHILKLTAENVKRIKVVEIEPAGKIVEIAGKNGQGKTSVLDSILWALGGKGAVQWEPIRHGQERAVIALDIGDERGLRFRVTRTFRATDDERGYTTELTVENEKGQRPKGPQDILNAMIGTLTLDPLEFQRAKPGERVKMVKALIPGTDFDALATERDLVFRQRTDVNREAKRLRTLADAIPIQPDDPDDKIDTEPLLARLAEAARQASDIAAEAGRRDNLRAEVRRQTEDAAARHRQAQAARDSAAGLRRQAEEEEARAARLDAEGEQLSADALDKTRAIEELPPIPEPPDTEAMKAQVEEAHAANRRWEKNSERRDLETRAGEQEQEAQRLSDRIDSIDAEVLRAVESADLPVRGMTFDNDGDVRLHGVPFSQAADSEQLRASVAIAIAANPRLRVIRIRDASLLDTDAFAILADVAERTGTQIWAESVFPHSDAALIMEDGHLKETAK